MSIYDDKPLSEVPYDKIKIGLAVLSVTNTLGKVSEKISKEDHPNRDNDNLIKVKWDNGNESLNFHLNFHKVKVIPAVVPVVIGQ